MPCLWGLRMRRQDVVWEMESDYAGHPYYVSGNAILHALANAGRLDYDEQRGLRASHGVFCPGVYGKYPDGDRHSQTGGTFSFPSTIKPIESYPDLFLFRRPGHRWIYDGRPRDATNTPPLRRHRDHYLIAPSQAIQTKEGQKPQRQQWYIHAYLTQAGGADVLPLSESRLDGLQFGRARNYGYGSVSVKDTAMTDLSELDYSWVADAESHVVELVTPYVVESEFPGVDIASVPWWWDQDLTYRRRGEMIIEQGQRYELETIDHGQVTRYEGESPVETARNGVARVGAHSKYGFGELWVRPADG